MLLSMFDYKVKFLAKVNKRNQFSNKFCKSMSSVSEFSITNTQNYWCKIYINSDHFCLAVFDFFIILMYLTNNFFSVPFVKLSL